MNNAWIGIGFLFGAVLGSFINVLSLRYDPDGRIFSKDILFGRSHCPHCKKNLSWYELIPLFSFLIQWGWCRSCRVRLSFQYPIVECISGLAVAFIPFAVYRTFSAAFW